MNQYERNVAALGAARLLLDNVLLADSSSSSSSEEELLLDLQELEEPREERFEQVRRRPARLENFVEHVIPQFTNQEFQQNFRLTKPTYQWLVERLTPFLESEPGVGREKIVVEKQILSTLWLLATPDSYRSTGLKFDLGKSSLWSCFYRVIQALNTIAPEIIHWPARADMARIKESFQAIAGMPSVVGAVDGTYVPIKAPKENPEVYYNRKNFYGITLQAISTPNLKFTDCFVGYPSSVHDSRIFRNSDIYASVRQNPGEYFMDHEFILGDKAYPVLIWCIPPYRNLGNLDNQQTLFNTVHVRTRQVIERTFALLFGRFRRLRFLDMNRTDLIPATIIAATVLHNICLMRVDELLERYIHEGEVFLQHQHNNQLEENDDEDNDFGDRHRGLVRRDEIARHIFRAQQRNNQRR